MQGRIAPWGVLMLAVAVAQAAPLHAQEQTRRIRLSRDTVVAGVRCASTGRAYAELYGNGGLVECPLAADSTIEGHAFPKGTWIRLHQDRGLDGAWLPRDTELQGVPCKGTGYKGWSVRFHAGGALALCYLSREATIDGVACMSGSFARELRVSTQVALHPSGRLKGCRLASSMSRDGVALKRGARIHLTATGAVVR
jgi:hypothetical protein